jgi:hypothetical protein
MFTSLGKELLCNTNKSLVWGPKVTLMGSQKKEGVRVRVVRAARRNV